MAQKSYNRSVKPFVEKEIKSIEQFLQDSKENDIDLIYDNYCESRKEWVIPIQTSVKERITQWVNEKKETNTYYQENLIYETSKEEYVRSKSEMIIADILYQNKEHILYKYERPLEIMINGKKTIIVNIDAKSVGTLSLKNKNIEIKNPAVGDKIQIGSAEALVIAPNNKEYSNTNNYSIGIILTHGENSFIFTGDAEASAEEEMINNGLLKDIDVYKAGHHGSSTSSSEEFLDVIKPEYAVIMCGEGNSYNHPNDDAMERIKKYVPEENIFRTDLNGSIVAESDGKAINFRTERQ